MKMRTVVASLFVFSALASAADDRIILYPSFVTKVRCEGRLLISSVGSDAQVRLDAYPKELGCAVLLKPLSTTVETNLVLETTTGTIRRFISAKTAKPTAGQGHPLPVLEYDLKGDAQ